MIGAPAKLPCPTCGYDVSGLREAKCPECGNAFDLRTIHLFEMPRLRVLLIALLLGSLTCSGAALLSIFNDNSPWMPLSVPSFLLGPFAGLGFAVCSVLWIWSKRVPVWMFVISGLLIVFSLLYLVESASFGLQYQGAAYVAITAAMDGFMIVSLIALAIIASIKGTFWWHYAFELFLGVWFVTYAFPWRGETI